MHIDGQVHMFLFASLVCDDFVDLREKIEGYGAKGEKRSRIFSAIVLWQIEIEMLITHCEYFL